MPMLRLGRRPDSFGLTAYGAELDQGFAFRDTAHQDTRAPEVLERYGLLPDREFVDAPYSNVVHRTPDLAGEAAHLNELGHGFTGGDVIWQVSISRARELRAFPPRPVAVRVSRSA